jgi:TIR domain
VTVQDLETFMVGQSPGRNFISYSRTDGAEYAAWLRTWLGKHDLSVWQDIVAFEGGLDWWSQIEDALRSPTLQHFILVVTPAALARPGRSAGDPAGAP